MPKKKMIFMIFMTFLLCIMTLGYAALQERIDVEVQADIDSTYRVEITSVAEGTTRGNGRSTQAASYTNDANNMTATFNVGLTDTTDYVTYTVTITNYSTVDVKLNDIEITSTNSNMDVIKSGARNGDIILHGGNLVLTIKIRLSASTSSEQTGTITVSPKYTRLKGGVGNVEADNIYAIGEVVSFAGSNWYVIEDSPKGQDYVVAIKQTSLTNDELGDEASSSGVRTASYYHSSTCHSANTYGYTSSDTSGCKGHALYENSSIKVFLENTYMPTLGANNLKEINGYKIRLITREQLIDDFGYLQGENAYYSSSATPSWIYSGFDGSDRYWITNVDIAAYTVSNSGGESLIQGRNIYGVAAVRPVINLLKTSISN